MMRRAGLRAWTLVLSMLSMLWASGLALAQPAEVPAQMGGSGPLSTRT